MLIEKKNIYYAKLFLIQIKFFKNKIKTKEFFTNVTFVLGKKICDKEWNIKNPEGNNSIKF